MSYCTEANFQVAPGVFTHDYTVQEVEAAGGCCQSFVCGVRCPAEFDDTGVWLGFGVPVALVSASWAIMGIAIAFLTLRSDADYTGFFVCNRSLPLYIVAFALLGQGLDTSSSLGNVVNSFRFSFWDGAVMPIGVGLSLILNGAFLASPINRMGLLTLPDLFRRKYGAFMEVIVSLIEIASFTVLLGANLVGISLVLQFCFGLPKAAGVAISGSILAVYTASGGLYSVALTDIPQALGGFSGLLVTAVYMMATEPGTRVPPPSTGFVVDLGGNVTAATPGYAGPPNCVNPSTGLYVCDNYAYPDGDKLAVPHAMTDPNAYAPFPNAVLYNWVSIFVLGFGNMCALDFQARCIAAKSPRTARIACFIAGVALVLLAVPFGMLGGLTRKYFGPDSQFAEFEVDTCSAPLGRPSCAKWLPQENTAVFRFLWEQAPRAIGAWAMIAMVAASVSTADGAILATSTVMAHNIWRKVPRIGATDRNLLWVARIVILPMTLLACTVAWFAYRPGALLVISFDIVLAGVFVPLMAAVHWPNVSPNAGILSCISGSLLRITLEQVLPKDGSLVAPLSPYAMHYGQAVPGLPSFMEVNPPQYADKAGVWNPDTEVCQQRPMVDWTGLDSILSPAFSLVVMVVVMAVEKRWPGLDLLWFLPVSWRRSSPLYPSDDPSVRPWGAKLAGLGLASASTSQGGALGRRRGSVAMPSVPEDDPLFSAISIDSTGGDAEGEDMEAVSPEATGRGKGRGAGKAGDSGAAMMDTEDVLLQHLRIAPILSAPGYGTRRLGGVAAGGVGDVEVADYSMSSSTAVAAAVAGAGGASSSSAAGAMWAASAGGAGAGRGGPRATARAALVSAVGATAAALSLRVPRRWHRGRKDADEHGGSGSVRVSMDRAVHGGSHGRRGAAPTGGGRQGGAAGGRLVGASSNSASSGNSSSDGLRLGLSMHSGALSGHQHGYVGDSGRGGGGTGAGGGGTGVDGAGCVRSALLQSLEKGGDSSSGRNDGSSGGASGSSTRSSLDAATRQW
ncbi:hypothetical protein HXX76_015918 [Chlamydomonas incerta]|uniref:Uncharacterized protein n=1 Tax=Chlamydomonas incerta TaxID=51695 RepID=A0A835VP66_CHLIN|nr:hypothetical protein HXX76_015918 [Chlamydomonas incerta]|eukprot:KAG2422590.1 hypothetical protein HXX76_015918 [Chlamydomonas incerta]